MEHNFSKFKSINEWISNTNSSVKLLEYSKKFFKEACEYYNFSLPPSPNDFEDFNSWLENATAFFKLNPNIDLTGIIYPAYSSGKSILTQKYKGYSFDVFKYHDFKNKRVYLEAVIKLNDNKLHTVNCHFLDDCKTINNIDKLVEAVKFEINSVLKLS